jgi:PAS domain S-box-containing protein
MPTPRDPQPFHLPEHGQLNPKLLAQMTDMSPDAIMFVDTRHTIRYWNQGAEDLFGYTAEEANGSYFDLLVPRDLLAAGELDRISAETEITGALKNYVTKRLTRDGRILTISLSRTRMVSAQGTTVGWGVILRDITDWERLHDELDEAKHLGQIGELASQIAHEVRNPLAGIHGALQILRRRAEKGSEEEDVFEQIGLEIGRMDHLVTDLLRFGRPASAQKNLTQLDEWVVDWLAQMEREATQREVSMAFRAEQAALVNLDGMLLGQVLRNLFENARESKEGHLDIQLRLSIEKGQATLFFEDDGPGIPEEIREKILEPFFTTKTRGSGLGLAICRRHLASLGGHLYIVKPDSAKDGARFKLQLPLAAPKKTSL